MSGPFCLTSRINSMPQGYYVTKDTNGLLMQNSASDLRKQVQL